MADKPEDKSFATQWDALRYALLKIIRELEMGTYPGLNRPLHDKDRVYFELSDGEWHLGIETIEPDENEDDGAYLLVHQDPAEGYDLKDSIVAGEGEDAGIKQLVIQISQNYPTGLVISFAGMQKLMELLAKNRRAMGL